MKGFLIYGLMTAFAVSVLGGCSAKKQLDEMHDATISLDEQTKKLGKTSEGIQDTSEQVKDISKDLDDKTAELYDALKQGDALASRRAALRTMVDAKEIPHKISEAGKYFMSFEVQLWSGMGQDNEEKRMQLAALAAREFFIDVQEFVVGAKHVAQPFAHGLTSKSNRTVCLNALAVALHETNPKQKIMLNANKGKKEISMYSMIEHALQAGRLIAEGEAKASDFPLYVKEILTYEDIAVLLMQSRYNFFGVLALARLVPTDNIKANVVKEKIGSLGRFVDKVASTKLETDLSRFNVFEIREFTSYLKDALRSHDVLVSAGQKPVLDPELRKFMAKLDTGKVHLAKSEEEPLVIKATSEKPEAEAEFTALLERYKVSGK